LKKTLDDIYKYREEFYKKVREGDLNEAYRIFKEIEKLYNSFENKIVERIENLVKIRALDIAKSKVK